MEQFYLVAERDECSSLNRDPDYKGGANLLFLHIG